MDKERILCAAIWYKEFEVDKSISDMVKPFNIEKGLVVYGWRHGNCISLMKAQTGYRTVTYANDGVGEHEQGFLTSKNRFVSRKEAGEIAFKAGQIEKENDYLFSEDLY